MAALMDGGCDSNIVTWNENSDETVFFCSYTPRENNRKRSKFRSSPSNNFFNGYQYSKICQNDNAPSFFLATLRHFYADAVLSCDAKIARIVSISDSVSFCFFDKCCNSGAKSLPVTSIKFSKN